MRLPEKPLASQVREPGLISSPNGVLVDCDPFGGAHSQPFAYRWCEYGGAIRSRHPAAARRACDLQHGVGGVVPLWRDERCNLRRSRGQPRDWRDADVHAICSMTPLNGHRQHLFYMLHPCRHQPPNAEVTPKRRTEMLVTGEMLLTNPLCRTRLQ